MLKQFGQAMVEYTIVTAAFVTGLLVLNNGACPNQYEDCIEYLLTVMHDNSDGYSNSITAVQDYGKSFKPASAPEWPDDGSSDDDSDGGGSPGDIEPDGITQNTLITSSGGMNNHGVLDGGNVLDPDGNIVGTYINGVFMPANGGAGIAATEKKVVTDEAGNILQMQAVVDCNSGNVFGFGYRSEVSDKFVHSLNLAEENITGYCLAPAYEVVGRDGKPGGGRIVNGLYYPLSDSKDLEPKEPVGEVVYWPDLNDCAVMVTGWDSELDPDLSDEERYAEQVLLYADTDPATSPFLGRLSAANYVEQTFLYGNPEWPNDCVSSITVSAP